MKFSLIIPAKNEEKRIVLPLLEYYASLHRRFGSKNFEIIIVVNNTTDNTVKVLRTIKRVLRAEEIKIKEIDNVYGKGDAIVKGISFAKGTYVAFTDADGSTGATSLLRIYTALASDKTIQAAFGSRSVQGAKIVVPESKLRVFFGKTFNTIARTIFSIDSGDTQCGAKAFTRKSFSIIQKDILTYGWTFDINLYMAYQGQYKEVPVVWRDKKGSQLSIPKAIVTVSIELLVLFIKNIVHKTLSKQTHSVYLRDVEA